MLSPHCRARLAPLVSQLRDFHSSSRGNSTGATSLLKLSPCQACHIRKFWNRFSHLDPLPLRTRQIEKFKLYSTHDGNSTTWRTSKSTGSTGAGAGSTGASAGSTGASAGSTGASAGSTGASAGSTGASTTTKPTNVTSAVNDKISTDGDPGSEPRLDTRSKAVLGEKGTGHGKVTMVTADEQPVLTTPTKSPTGTALRNSRRAKIDWTASYYANTYVTPIHALNEYMLISADLETLPKYTRRSPFVGVGNMSVYLKQDIERKAYEVWGGKESFLQEKERRRQSQEVGDVMATLFKKALKQYRRTSRKSEYDRPKPYVGDVRETVVGSVFKTGTGKVVLYAICINFANFVLKSVAWLYTGSHCMFAEAIHSAADTFNQLILAVGIHKSIKVPDRQHPYGYDNLRYVSSLISGVGIFCIGAGLSWYHGIMGILHPDSVESLYWAMAILGGSLISEGGTLMLALNQALTTAKRDGISLLQYVREGYDPSTNVVLLEDLAAVLGVMVAGGCMAATAYTGNVLWDASGSIVIGCLLASVASFIVYTNSRALVGRSIPYYQTEKMCQLLESDRMVRAIHDVKATDMGGKFVRFKAEVDFDGKELTRAYLDKLDIDSLLIEMQSQKNIEQVEEFMLRHGEKIVDALGMEVDRLEQKIIKNFPKVRHMDLEIL